jgi:glycosyltransferase involved in cell wall biosynthesis
VTNKKIYVVIKTPAGGAWHTAMLTAHEWSKHGYDVHITSFLNDPFPFIDGIKTNPMMYKRMKGESLNRPFTILLSFYLMIRWFIREKPTHIMSVGLPITIPIAILNALFFWRKAKLSVLVETHPSAHLGHKKKQNNSLTFRVMAFITHNKFLYQWVMGEVSKIIALSNAIGDDLIENYGLDRAKIHVIPPFINTEFFEYPLPDQRPNNKILSIGRLSSEKNLGDLLKAFQFILRKKPDVNLDIVGDGECRAELEKQAANLGLSDHLTFHGARYDVDHFHAQTGVQVLCSHYEGFPLALVEACANGVPMVSYDGPSGPRDAIIDGVNGYIVHQYDVKALTEAIIKTLDQEWDYQSIRDSASQFHPDNVRGQVMMFIKDFI